MTVADATRDSSAVESFRVRAVGSVVDRSEHDKMMQKANAVVSMPVSPRFMMVPMNRATSFIRVANYLYASAPRGAGIYRNSIVTVNAR